MMTFSGRLCLPHNAGAPTLDDIVLGLSRAPRFAGHTRRPWSVAEHSLVCHEIAQRIEYRGPDTGLRLCALLHDAHETVTGDVPTLWKPPLLREWQDALDERIHLEQGGDRLEWTRRNRTNTLKLIDRFALGAEAALFGTRLIGTHDSIPASDRWTEEAVGAVVAYLPADRHERDVMHAFRMTLELELERWRAA